MGRFRNPFDQGGFSNPRAATAPRRQARFAPEALERRLTPTDITGIAPPVLVGTFTAKDDTLPTPGGDPLPGDGPGAPAPPPPTLPTGPDSPG